MSPLGGHELATSQVWVLAIFAVICGVTDLVKGKVYNVVTYPAIVLGFVLQVILFGGPGFFSALAGFAIGFFPAFLFFLLAEGGGGDVKLLGAVGAIAGGVAATEAMLLGFLFAAFVGLGQLAWHGVLFRSLVRMGKMMIGVVVPSLRPGPLPEDLKHKIRFGGALALGVLVMLWDLKTGLIASLLS